MSTSLTLIITWWEIECKVKTPMSLNFLRLKSYAEEYFSLMVCQMQTIIGSVELDLTNFFLFLCTVYEQTCSVHATWF